MSIITIQIGNSKRNVKAPESWDDLDLRTLMLYYQTLFTAHGSEYTASGFTMVKLITMTQNILGVDSAFLAQWEADCKGEDEDNGDLIFLQELREIVHSTLKGLFDVRTDDHAVTTYSVRLNRLKCPWPVFSHTPTLPKGSRKTAKTTRYYAPDDGLENITLYELAYTFSTFEAYLQTQEEQHAYDLIGMLYRPSRPQTQADRDSEWFGDRRMPLRRYEKKIAERAALAKTLPPLTRRLILFWFASCRQDIINQHPKVFRHDGEVTNNYGWGGVLLAMAGGPAGLDAIADQNYGNGLTWLSIKEDERRELEARSKKKTS